MIKSKRMALKFLGQKDIRSVHGITSVSCIKREYQLCTRHGSYFGRDPYSVATTTSCAFKPFGPLSST
jgi:hypothetical protein